MNMIMIIYTIVLFVLLTPSILFRIPKKGNKLMVAFVHGVIFAIIYSLTHKMFQKMYDKENFRLYSDSNCINMRVGPLKNNIPDTDSGPIYYKAVKNNNQCTGAEFAK